MDDLSNGTRDEFEAQILAELEKLGIDTQKHPVHFEYEHKVLGDWRKPITTHSDGRMSITSTALQELLKTPSPFTEHWNRKIDKIWEEIARDRASRLQNLDYLLPEFKIRIADLSAAQANDHALAGDTLLSTYIVNLGEAFQVLGECVQQLRHGKPIKESHNTVAKPDMRQTLLSIGECFRYLLSALEKDIVRAFKDGTWQEDRELRDAYDDFFHKLQDVFTAVVDRVIPQSTEPSELP